MADPRGKCRVRVPAVYCHGTTRSGSVTMSDQATLGADGRQLGKYRLLRQLGRGGAGTVYEAEDRLLRRRVAVKMLCPELSDDPDALKRFLREAQAAAALHHPHVVT